MSDELTHARVADRLAKLRLTHVVTRLDSLLSDAARSDVTYLDFLDRLLVACPHREARSL